MEYLESLSQFQMAGIILQLLLLPFLVMRLRLFWWVKQSMQWPKVNGKVMKGMIFQMPKSLGFLFTYEINGITYEGDKPFFIILMKHSKSKKYLI